MSAAHVLTLAVHIAAGGVALLVGAMLLLRTKGTATHRRWGRVFGVLAGVVCASAAVAMTAFGYQALFAVLTLTVAYQVWGGWRAARFRGDGPGWWDAGITLLAAVACLGLWLAPKTWTAPTLGALGWLSMVLLYDAVRWVFPRRWFAMLWRHEHACKWIACVSGMASALLGNVWRGGQPWSQLLPSVAGVLLMTWYCLRMWRDARARSAARWQDRRICPSASP
jgi:uncharacterized membrane protein